MTDWDLIVKVNLDDLDDEKAELLYDQLIEVNPSDESNIDLLRSAFKAAKCVMQVKALQADVAVEELEEYIKKNDKNELENLRKQVDLYKSSLVNQHGLDPMSQIKDYQNQLADLKETLEGKNNDLSRSKRRIGDLETKLQLNEKEIESLQDEIISLKEEMETRQHGLRDSIAETAEPLEKLREKNKQIQSLLDELDLMERANVELARQVKTLKDQLSLATNEVKSAADEMETMRNQCLGIQEMNENLIKEKEYFLKENDSYRKQLDSIHEKHDNTTSKLNDKMNELIEMIKEKDTLIGQLNGSRSNQPGPPSLSSINEKSNSLLLQELTEKSETINYLKEQLTEAVNTIQGQNELIKKLTKQSKSPTNDQSEIDGNVEQSKKKVEQMKVKIDQLEDELKAKDDELHQVTKMKMAYERGEYGLAEALNEVKALKKQLLTKERHLEEAIQDLNQLSIKLNSYEDQLDFLKEMGSGSTLNGLDSLDTEKILPEIMDDRIKVLRLQQTIIKLEDEKIALQEKLRAIRLSSGSQSVERIDNQSETKQLDDERAKMVSHLKVLQDENRGLQLGMKEILFGIHESNSRSDVVIDCPSLERLVNLLEGRSLSADLTTVIALKGELDLVRGQNQQLVMELKRLRHEHFKLICVYADEISAQMKLNHNHKDSRKTKSTINCENVDDEETTSSSTIISTTSSTTTSTSTIVENENIKPTRQSVDSNYELSEGEVLFSSELDKNPLNLQSVNENLNCQDEIDEDENTIEAEDEDVETTVDCDLDETPAIVEDNLTLESPMVVNEHDQFEPKELVKLDKANQTNELVKTTISIQTDEIIESIVSTKCSKCAKLLTVVMDIKDHIEKLSDSITESETHYFEQIELTRKENNLLHEHIQSWKEKYSKLLTEKDEFLLNKSENGLKSRLESENSSQPVEVDEMDDQQSQQQLKTSTTNKAIPKVLETIIECLQKRIEQKETAILELEALIRSNHENYEREIGKLINEKPLISETISFDPISLNRMVQADELRTDLDKCYKQLEECKQEAYHRIQCLLEQLEKEKIKSKKLQEQLDRFTGRIKIKSSTIKAKNTINNNRH